MARIRTGGLPQKKKQVPIDPAAVGKALAHTKRGIDSGMLLNSLIENFGGPARFTAAIFAEFQAAPEGSMPRQKILEMISRLTIVVTSQSMSRNKRGEDMDDEELQDAAASLLGRLKTDEPETADPAPAS